MSDIHGNSSTPVTGTATRMPGARPGVDEERLGVRGEAIGPDAIDPDRGARRSRRNKKLLLLLVIVILFGGGAALGVYILVKRSNWDVLIGRNRGQTDERRLAEGLQQQAIKEATAATGPAVQPTPQIIVVEPTKDATAEISQPITEPSPETSVVTDERSATQNHAGKESSSPAAMKRQASTSIWMAVNPPSGRLSRPFAAVAPLTKEVPKTAPVAPPLPPFGQMLPVRTLGAIYTLRQGSLTRFELTRDSDGPGWSLPRGTVFVGTLRGGGMTARTSP